MYHSFYVLREHARIAHGAQRRCGTQNAEVTQVIGAFDHNEIKDELATWKHFFLDHEIKNGRHRGFQFFYGRTGLDYFYTRGKYISIVQLCLMNLSSLCSESYKMGNVGINMRAKFFKQLEWFWLVATKADLSKFGKFWITAMKSNCAQDNVQIQSEKFANWWMLQILQRYSRKL